MIGFDTTTLIDFFRKNKELKELLDSIDEDFCTTLINYQEIIFGIDISDYAYLEEFNFYQSLFNNLILIIPDKNSCDKSSDIFWHLKKNNKLIDKFDIMVAGVLLSNGITKIITKNKKHYENIPGLKVISY
ncbi:type II toxin-antitoxin system VapC family toxin [Candidatus Pacearchaeota archaeon]|nr:type II toxin-antitoxin system VapC family toxin [Candidatus Pacearchaeota archaeon]